MTKTRTTHIRSWKALVSSLWTPNISRSQMFLLQSLVFSTSTTVNRGGYSVHLALAVVHSKWQHRCSQGETKWGKPNWDLGNGFNMGNQWFPEDVQSPEVCVSSIFCKSDAPFIWKWLGVLWWVMTKLKQLTTSWFQCDPSNLSGWRIMIYPAWKAIEYPCRRVAVI